MKLTKLTNRCDDGECPTVYISDRGTLVAQGDPVSDADGLLLGVGELAVELPIHVVREAVRALGE